VLQKAIAAGEDLPDTLPPARQVHGNAVMSVQCLDSRWLHASGSDLSLPGVTEKLMQIYKVISRGMFAGVLATCILSLLMLIQWLPPRFETVTLLIGMARVILEGSGLPAPFAGWLWFFIIGGLWWGSWFAIVEQIIPGRAYWIKGAVFGVVTGLLVIWTVMPLAAGGALGMKLSLWQPVVTVSEHLVYGLVLGVVYGWLSTR
jgi:hypothetical protein